MPKTAELSYEERLKIIEMRKRNISIRQIGRELGYGYSTVRYNIEKFKNTGSVLNAPGRGRYEVISQSDKRYIKLISTRFRTKGLPEITKEFNESRKNRVCQTTIRKVLLKWGLKGRVAAKKPLLRKQNVKKRLLFAKNHVNWTKEQWAKVVFTDESKFELFGTKRRVFVRRREGERFEKHCVIPTVKHGGGSVMVWGGISVKGAIPLKRIIGTMDMRVYFFLLLF